MRLRVYSNIKPATSDPAETAEKIYNYLGPAIPDWTAWGLLRPGLLTKRLVIDVCNLWKAEKRKQLVIYDRPQIRGKWIFFDYLFSKIAAANPIIKCLTNIGLAKYGKTRLKNTYLVTVGLNYESGLLLMLYNGKRIETQLDDLAYVISHMLEATKPKVVEINRKLLANLAFYFESSPRWQIKGWISKDGRTIELDLVQQNREEYIERLKQGEWRTLLFQNDYSKIKLTIGPRVKSVEVYIKKKYYNPGPKRELRPTFEELAKGLQIEKLVDIVPSVADEASIQRAYTERRGIMAVLKLRKEKQKREAFDVSYEFLGYDVKSEPHLIEVKAFKDSAYKPLQLTQNEYETMNKEENYHIYVVEEAWDKIPKINVIPDPQKIPFTKQSRDTLETKITQEEYYECTEDKWKSNVKHSEYVEL